MNEGVAFYKKNNCDGVIAFGGGSALDVGKAIAFMSGQNLPLWDFEDVGDNWTKANSDKISPIIAAQLFRLMSATVYYFQSSILSSASYRVVSSPLQVMWSGAVNRQPGYRARNLQRRGYQAPPPRAKIFS